MDTITHTETRVLVNVDAEKFWIASQFQSTEALRYYLNGVYVEPIQGDGVLMVAADGHRLVAIHDPNGIADKPYILKAPKDLTKTLKKAAYVQLIGDQLHSIDKNTGATLCILPDSVIDGTFPDWRRVIPTEQSGEPSCGFNPSYVGSFAALNGYTQSGQVKPKDKGVVIHQNGKGPAIITCGQFDRIGVLMPIDKIPESPINPAFLGL